VALLLERAWARGGPTMVMLLICMVISMIHFRWAWIPLETLRYTLIALGTVTGGALIAWIWWTDRRGYREPGDEIAEAGAKSGA
jgi:hypothetical protein